MAQGAGGAKKPAASRQLPSFRYCEITSKSCPRYLLDRTPFKTVYARRAVRYANGGNFKGWSFRIVAFATQLEEGILFKPVELKLLMAAQGTARSPYDSSYVCGIWAQYSPRFGLGRCGRVNLQSRNDWQGILPKLPGPWRVCWVKLTHIRCAAVRKVLKYKKTYPG